MTMLIRNQRSATRNHATSASSLLAVPMLRQGRPMEHVAIRLHAKAAFPDTTVELLQTFADQAVIAIENARLFEEVQARTAELTEGAGTADRDHRGLGVISSSPGELEPVFRAMLENALGLRGKVPVVCIFAREMHCASSQCTAHRPNGSNTDVANLLSIRARILGFRRIVRTKQVVHIPDITAEQAYSDGPRSPCYRKASWRTDVSIGAPAPGRGSHRRFHYLPPRSPPVHRQADRLSPTSPIRPSSPSRTHVCSTSCGKIQLSTDDRLTDRQPPTC